MLKEPLLEVEDLTIQYRTAGKMITAVSNASFSISHGEYFGLVGESGCGKSTIARAIMGGLDENGQITSGTIRIHGQEIQDLSDSELSQQVRWKEISWIPQGSMSSLDPLQRISEQATEIAQVHSDLTEREAVARMEELFDVVGLPRERVTDYPHQFSGGMQQRTLIALSLFLEPSLLIADEPTTALDVIMQDQVFKYLDEIKADLGVGMLLITHDISLVFESCDRMAVMHSGQVAEVGDVRSVYQRPRHPYSILLQEAFPDIRYPNRKLGVIEGNPPQNVDEVDYCTFVDRCPWAVTECGEHAPIGESISDGDPDHVVSCFRKEDVHGLYQDERERVVSTDGDGS